MDYRNNRLKNLSLAAKTGRQTAEQPFHIKGCCEECGYAYKGDLPYNGGVFPLIKCPNCKRETHNFDEAHIVEGLEKAEGFQFDYIESKFEIIAQ